MDEGGDALARLLRCNLEVALALPKHSLGRGQVLRRRDAVVDPLEQVHPPRETRSTKPPLGGGGAGGTPFGAASKWPASTSAAIRRQSSASSPSGSQPNSGIGSALTPASELEVDQMVVVVRDLREPTMPQADHEERDGEDNSRRRLRAIFFRPVVGAWRTTRGRCGEQPPPRARAPTASPCGR